jgi:hypothetical protein
MTPAAPSGWNPMAGDPIALSAKGTRNQLLSRGSQLAFTAQPNLIASL